MTAPDVLVELGLIAALLVGSLVLVMLMLEKDRKRAERRARIERLNDSHQGAEASESRPSSYPQTEEPPCQAAQEENHVG